MVDWDPESFAISMVVVALSFLGWCAVMELGKRLSLGLPAYQRLNEGQKREWTCRIVAFTHSIVAVVSMTHAVWNFPYPQGGGTFYSKQPCSLEGSLSL